MTGGNPISGRSCIMTIQNTLRERLSTHGNFEEQSDLIYKTLDVWQRSPNWIRLPPYMKNAIYMILHKYGRILVGDPYFYDHWHDIVGYNQLVVDLLALSDQPRDDPNYPGTP